MSRAVMRWLSLLLLSVVGSVACAAVSTTPLSYRLFEDKSAALSVPQIQAAAQFGALQQGRKNIGYSKSVFWLQAFISNPSQQTQRYWLDLGESRQQSVILYQLKNRQWQSVNAGFDTPIALHPVAARNAVFQLDILAGQTVPLFLSIQSKTAIAFAPMVWEPLAFREAEARENFWEGVFLGAISLVVVCCLILMAFMKEHSFLLQGVAVVCFALNETNMRGYGFLYLWPESTVWSVHSLALFGQLYTIFFILFMRHFLNTPVLLPWGDRVLRGLLILQCVAIFISHWLDYQLGVQFGLLQGLFGIPLLLPICWQVMKKGARAMRFFVMALLVFLLGNVLRSLDLVGLIVVQPWFAGHFMLGVVLFSLFVFLLAIIDRVMQARRDKDQLQQTLIDTLNTQQVALEKAVAVRTEELLVAVDEAQAANQLKNKLLAYFSHDLRAPLATIIGYARLMKPQHTDYPIVIERCAEQQLQLIDELLKYARGEMQLDDVELSVGRFDVLLNEISELALLLAGQQQNRFILSQTGRMPSLLYADWRRLRQVLQNLVSNASKHTRYGVIALSLDWQDVAEGIVLGVSVSDTGEGIALQDHARIFLPFERACEGKAGHGLGLSIASQMVHSMGGELKLQSSLEFGCRFYFELHLQRGEVDDQPSCAPKPLTAEDLSVLRALVAQGQISEIEDWAQRVSATSSASQSYILQVNAAAQRLDFEALEVLAG